jgi:hypothetical protein
MGILSLATRTHFPDARRLAGLHFTDGLQQFGCEIAFRIARS